MRNVLVIVLIATLTTVSPAFAKASKQENIGVGSGAVVGGLAGGPVGFIIGAAIGAKLGEKMHQKSEKIETLSDSLASSESAIEQLEQDASEMSANIDTLSAELERFETIDRPKLVSLMQAGISMDLLFRTDEHVLADTTGGRLAELAGGVASMPDIRVQLDGFADERGDADYNLQLSRKRVEFVRDQLISAGVNPSRIKVSAHGEAAAQDESVDSYALERRVSLKLFIEDAPSRFDSQPVASTP
jgi:outer membrane protein OmpA-like peptidoglycan-associated protein